MTLRGSSLPFSNPLHTGHFALKILFKMFFVKTVLLSNSKKMAFAALVKQVVCQQTCFSGHNGWYPPPPHWP
jgi:hypothetical protein